MPVTGTIEWQTGQKQSPSRASSFWSNLGSTLLGGVAGLVNTGYQIYQDQRDFDYQKHLQQEIFNREDTAVQRRMADLEAAGLNPNLAMGDGASAGSVVGRSTGQAVDFGSALDTMKAVNQMKLESVDIQNKREEHDMLVDQKDLVDIQKKQALEDYYAKRRENQLGLYQSLYEAGYDPEIILDRNTNKNGDFYDFIVKPKGNPDYSTTRKFYWKSDPYYVDVGSRQNYFAHGENRMRRRMDYDYATQANSAALLQKNVDWYVANAVANMVTGGTGAAAKMIGAIKSGGVKRR